MEKERKHVYGIQRCCRKKCNGFVLMEMIVFFVMALFLTVAMQVCAFHILKSVQYGEMFEEMLRQRFSVEDTLYSEVHHSIKPTIGRDMVNLFDGKNAWRLYCGGGIIYRWLLNDEIFAMMSGNKGPNSSSAVYLTLQEKESRYFFPYNNAMEGKVIYRDKRAHIYWPYRWVITPWRMEWKALE